jgi:parallel beta-helix repeat protein
MRSYRKVRHLGFARRRITASIEGGKKMKREKLTAVLLAAAMVLGMAGSARAVDGVIAINQAKVLASGGFPSSVSTGGSYRLTSNLTVPSCTGALASANNTTIDLNGFFIVGPGCGIGINVGNSVTVENGTVTGFSLGVSVGNNSIVRNVHADANGQGIVAGSNAVLEGCTANNSNSSEGGVAGMQGGAGSTISGNTANGNRESGIQCASCTISGNTADNNFENGITATGGVISGNTANSNKIGIDCLGSGCLITGNAIDNNSQNAIVSTDATTAYGGNVMNGDGPISGGTSMGAMNTNSCGGSAC